MTDKLTRDEVDKLERELRTWSLTPAIMNANRLVRHWKAEAKRLQTENAHLVASRDSVIPALNEHIAYGRRVEIALKAANDHIDDLNATLGEFTNTPSGAIIEALRKELQTANERTDRILACHEHDAGRCMDCRKLTEPHAEWMKYFTVVNELATANERIGELEEAIREHLRQGPHCVFCEHNLEAAEDGKHASDCIYARLTSGPEGKQ